MNNRIVILGAGGHGRVVADVALLFGYKEVMFLDDSAECTVKTSGKISDYLKYISNSDFFVSIGNNTVREKITNDLINNGANIATIIHPSAVIGSRVSLGIGTVVMAGAVINCDTKIGNGVIINTCASVDHDCTIRDYCHISVGSHLAGTVTVGKSSFIGAGATVINNVFICENCMIGAGALVVKDIKENGTYIGVPVKRVIK